VATYEVLEHDLTLLVRCGTLDGLPAKRVKGLLGPPDQARDGDWAYDVGVPITRSDYVDFHVRFDADGRVSNAVVPGFLESGVFLFFSGDD
jgi:hypothetical protein